MKSNHSSTNKLSWSDSLLNLAVKNKPSQSLLKLQTGGVETLYDLIWITPLRVQKIPHIEPFQKMELDKLFLGEGKMINFKLAPAFGRRGKGRMQLFNATAMVQDLHGHDIVQLRWFNTYPNFKKQIESLQSFIFMGAPSEFKGQLQIVNPKINPSIENNPSGLLIEYPTFNTVPGKQIQKIIDKIPNYLWQESFQAITNPFLHQLKLAPVENSFLVLHGKSSVQKRENALERIVYEEFFQNQLKVQARKLKNKTLKAQKYNLTHEEMNKYEELFPYQLTVDQKKCIEIIQHDLNIGHPMMRLIQGDVGCGKTTVAMLASMIIVKNKAQVAFMCPTETLAFQHYTNIKTILGEHLQIEILLGGAKNNEKLKIYQRLKEGDIDLIVGTHSLFQESVEFKNLQLAIIDEQHKFGVNQRQKLRDKGVGVHTLIMTATPIPRSLQLAQYGDLDISTIKTLPGERKGIQTRIVTKQTYEKYLSFVKTRIELGEQAYIVVPAIEESINDLNTVEELLEIYKKYYPDLEIAALHGQVKNEEKQKIMNHFLNKKIDILIATTVIEVGIDIKNATVISIYNPERFGLSSLHQLRGRVGRGNKAGFCFLICDQKTPKDSMERLKVIERSHDGFEIAEADLKIRGQGDLFGSSQSGHLSDYRFANVFKHFDLFEKVSQDIEKLKEEAPEKLNEVLLRLSEDQKVSSTI